MYSGVFLLLMPPAIGSEWILAKRGNCGEMHFLNNDIGFIFMKKVAGLFVFMASILTVPVAVQAEGLHLDAKRFYVGGGLSFNDLAGVGSSRGFQFFGGYNFKFKLNEDISTALELGYMDSGNFDRLNTGGNAGDANGLWVTALESVPLTSKVDMLARLGYDLGEDDGFILGTGLQYKFDTKVALRMEYVAREHVNGLQVNVLVKF